MYPSLRDEDSSNWELIARVKIRLPAGMDDTGERSGSGLELLDGVGVECRFAGEVNNRNVICRL